MKNKILLWLLIALNLAQNGCTQAQKKFDQDLADGRCEEALAELPARDPSLHMLNQAQTAAGSAVSYSATGIAYAGDVLITVTGGTLIVVALCGPLIVAAAQAHYSGNGSFPPTCLPAPKSMIHLPHFGRDTYKSTQSWRCPDLTGASRSIRKVAACFSRQGGQDGLKKAKATLDSISSTSNFNACVSNEEKSLIDSDRNQVLAQLGSEKP